MTFYRSNSYWLCWSYAQLMWNDFWVTDDYGNLTRVSLRQAWHSLSWRDVLAAKP